MVSDPVAATDWRQLASDTEIPDGMLIGGQRRAALDGSTRSVKAARDGSVVLKTAEQSSPSMQRVADLGVTAGLPPGVFNVISGDGQVTGRRLGEHLDVDVLTFVSRDLRAGTVWVNCYEEGDIAVPFGGVTLSGFGRDKSRHALDEYTSLKTTWIRYA